MFRKVSVFSLLLVLVAVSFKNLCYAELTIDTSGNVGIGATTPGAKLHVNSTANTNNTIGIFESDIDSGEEYNEFRFSAAGNTSPAAIRYLLGTNPNSSELSFLQQPDSGSGLVERMRINKSGNVGIGTENPATLLELDDSTNGGTYNEAPTTGLVIHGDNTITTTARGNLTIMTADNQAIDLGGSLAFGGRFTDSISTTVNFAQISGRKSNSTSANKEGYLAFATRRPVMTEAMRIDSAGNVGIGTTGPSYKLHVNGTAAGTSWTNLSSREYKENIRKVDSSKYSEMLVQLMDIDLTKYNYKQAYTDDTTEKIGFIAEDMPKEVLSSDGKGVDIYELVTYTIGAMKAQQEENKTLKAENEQLKSELTSLKDRQTVLEDMFLAITTTFPKEKLAKLGEVQE